MTREVFWLQTGGQTKAEDSVCLPAPQHLSASTAAVPRAGAGPVGDPAGALGSSVGERGSSRVGPLAEQDPVQLQKEEIRAARQL